MKAYWNKNTKISFTAGILAVLLSIPIFVSGNSKGVLCSSLNGFEARLFAVMVIIVALCLMSTIYTNKEGKSLSAPGFLILVIALPVLQLLARTITQWLGK